MAGHVPADQGDAPVIDEDGLRIRKFLEEIRRHWPGARIVLHPGELPEHGVAAQDDQPTQAARMSPDRILRRVIEQQVLAYRQGVVPAGGVSWTARERAMGLHPAAKKDCPDDF
jgi:hypothetical protein